MKKFVALALMLNFLVLPHSWASRVPEIESFFSQKVTEVLKMRFPDKPFTVFVSVDTGEREKVRTDIRRRSQNKNTRLPLLDEDQEDMDVWDRTDLPIGTLISQLQSIRISIQVDSSLTDQELKELQTSIAKQLKLDDRVDVVDVTRMEWTQAERYRNIKWIGGGALLFLVLMSLVSWAVARFSIKNLVKGLAKPIQEIGKSTKQFANDALNIATDMAVGSSTLPDENDSEEDAMSLGGNLLEIRKNALELIERNRDLFEYPDATLMELLERRGAQDPVNMGSILAELGSKPLHQLFQYGQGQWWFVALSQAGPLTPQSIVILSEIDKLRLRRQFAADERSKRISEFREVGLIFSRLSYTELANIFGGLSIEQVEPIMDLLPRTLSLAVAKNLYPGQWAVMLDTNRSVKPIDVNLLDKLEAKAKDYFSLRSDKEIQSFFQDLDLSTFLDTASPRDERDFYTVLPEHSRIKIERVPFFTIFEATHVVKKILGPVLSVEDWAMVLFGCEKSERDELMSYFPDRLRFQVNQKIEETSTKDIDKVRLRRLRRRVVSVCMEHVERLSNEIDQMVSQDLGVDFAEMNKKLDEKSDQKSDDDAA